ncbi:MAG TPA: hypothetical protein HPP94_07815 [Desulfuromonadales bacterium]|nr:hypothetical protein [Desulfuromonadales bacterium]
MAAKSTAIVAGIALSVTIGAGPVFSSSDRESEGSEKHESQKSESKLYGTVQKIPADRGGLWIVNGREIKVTGETRIKEEYGKAVSGSYVEVEGTNTGKVFTATKIEVKRAKK